MTTVKDKEKFIGIIIIEALVILHLTNNVIGTIIMAVLMGITLYVAINTLAILDLKKEYEKRIKRLRRKEMYYEEARKSYEDMWDEKFNSWQEKVGPEYDVKVYFALELFQFKSISELTKSSLKSKYKSLMKVAHPDNGGSMELSKMINTSYNLLKEML